MCVTNPNISNVGYPNFIDRSHLAFLEQIRVHRKTMARIRCPHELPPRHRSQTKLFHHAANALLIDSLAPAFQLAGNSPIAITREVLVNAFNPLSQLLVVGITATKMGCIGLVVIAADRETRYLAGFRNRSKFLAVITDVSAFLLR